MIEIWHNPRCSKSRQTLELLHKNGHAPTIRLYKDDAPSEDDIRDVLTRLGQPATALIRTGEALFKELELHDANEATLIAAMAQNPFLIERPVVLANGRAAIGRPPESVLEIL